MIGNSTTLDLGWMHSAGRRPMLARGGWRVVLGSQGIVLVADDFEGSGQSLLPGEPGAKGGS